MSDRGQTCDACARELEVAALKEEWETDASRGAVQEVSRAAFSLVSIFGGLALAVGLGVLVSIPLPEVTGYFVGGMVGAASIGPFVLLIRSLGAEKQPRRG